MSSRFPPLNALRAFVAAARHSSFRLAAEELNVTPGAVSRQIRSLELFLGIPLFDRSQRQVRLTEAGARYFTRIADLFTEIQQATDTLLDGDGRRTLRVDCIPTFAMHWLLPRLPLFQQRFPELAVSLSTAPGPIDTGRPFDYAIRRDPAHFAGLKPLPLMREHCVPVCSPSLPGLETLRSPADLTRRTVVTIRARADLLPAWSTAHGLELDAFRNRMEVDHTYFAIQAAEDGLGVAIVPRLFVERPLETGRLTAPLGAEGVVSGHYYLLESRQRGHTEAPAFPDWLREQAMTSGNPSPAPGEGGAEGAG
ncbi:LysR family transcriptional regulator [Azospirillum formosense]|uniref:LysR family transcriptional regulator n=1 Tax=Azospirillum formosense TaxID=861533 RepID=A0ABX2KZF4_9PROT|nr:LysR substrate-binding domain-containing protein [Azospirillum formosense]MBY3752227.1 LysR family transcriptional regulator [Azospirillum formosense]NUB22044.1 LysR family transcriptional regulator [Azospirillum formosense]